MIYLIVQLMGWLLLAAAFALLAGWAYRAHRDAPMEAAMRRDRAKLLRDLTALAVGERARDGDDHDTDAAQRIAAINGGRIAELEQALELARDRADEGASRVAELQRALEFHETEAARVAERERERDREIEVPAEPVQEDAALQAWRLRYFEQRVRYLESHKTQSAADRSVEWRAREAEARASYLEQEVRTLSAPPAEEEPQASPFASDADVDVLLRWRLLYLERRVAHLQAQTRDVASEPVATVASAVVASDPDRWKWRARYLEARVRHLETREPVAPIEPAAAIAAAEETRTPEPTPRPSTRGQKPPVMSAPRDGAPDDFTLIEGVSLMQQSTLYSLGVFHFDQIAAWTPENVAWVDAYLRLRGRIEEEDWLDQAADLAHQGPHAARRTVDEDA